MKKWMPIPIVNNLLEATKCGKIRNVKTKKIIKPYTRKGRPYKSFTYKVDNKLRTIYVHRCVISAFNPIKNFEKFDVHHKDHDPSNNNLSNLTWCTPSENFKYSYIDGRFENMKKMVSESSKKRIKNKTHIFYNLTEEQHRQKYITRSNNYKKNNNHPNKGKTGLKGTNVKLTVELINEIKKRNQKGEMKTKIAKSLNLSRATIYNVILGLIKY